MSAFQDAMTYKVCWGCDSDEPEIVLRGSVAEVADAGTTVERVPRAVEDRARARRTSVRVPDSRRHGSKG